MNILVTGATGYIGGRLIPLLLEKDHQVTVLARDPARMQGKPWAEQVKIVQGDIMEPDSLKPALEGIDAAYYMIHSMYAGAAFETLDRQAAQNFVQAAAGVKHVIYLGGILPPSKDSLSQHLQSRKEVGDILRSGLPTTEFRAGPIIGSGSASFEMIRYLTERLPFMIGPRWVLNQVQTIGIRDMLNYLVSALEIEPAGVLEVGSEPHRYLDLMRIYAEVRGLKRFIVPVPVLAPGLAARWVGLITPIPNKLAVPLVKGVIQPLIADTEKAEHIFPDIQPSSYRTSVERALEKISKEDIQTRWSGALGHQSTYTLTDWNGLFKETRSVHVKAPPEKVFSVAKSLGGDKGWLAWNTAWRFRGFIDRMVGGPGLRRGRRHSQELTVGEAVDFWRVEAIETPSLLRLRAEMKVPGKAWLQFEVLPEEGGARLVQQALFEPHGAWGSIYWWALYPIHKVIFSDLVNALARESAA